MSASDARPSKEAGVVTMTPEELGDLYSRTTTPISVEPVGRERGRKIQARQSVFGPLRVHGFASRTALRASTPYSGEVYVLAHARAGLIAFCNGGRDVPMAVGRFASLSSPGDAVEVDVHPGHVGSELVMPRAVVEAAFTALTGLAPRHLRLDPSFVQTTPRGAAAMRILSVVEHELERGVLGAVPSIAERLADSLVYAILAAQGADAAIVPLDPGPACVRRVEEWVEANLGEPLTLSELGAVAGVSVRALQLAFRAHRGCTPLQFLRSRRLERARALLASGRELTVTAVALDCSFEHLGRFSVRYRERFGESPADTLRRARGG